MSVVVSDVFCWCAAAVSPRCSSLTRSCCPPPSCQVCFWCAITCSLDFQLGFIVVVCPFVDHDMAHCVFQVATSACSRRSSSSAPVSRSAFLCWHSFTHSSLSVHAGEIVALDHTGNRQFLAFTKAWWFGGDGEREGLRERDIPLPRSMSRMLFCVCVCVELIELCACLFCNSLRALVLCFCCSCLSFCLSCLVHLLFAGVGKRDSSPIPVPQENSVCSPFCDDG